MAQPHTQTATVALNLPLYRGERRLRIALVGLPNSGKRTLFEAVSSTSVQRGTLAGTQRTYDECAVQIGFDEARVISLPGVHSLRHSCGATTARRCRATSLTARRCRSRRPTSSFR